MLMVEHRMEVVIGLAEKIAVMHHGALLAFDEPAAVMANETVQTAYLGEPLSASEPLIRVEDLHVYLGQSHILQGVSFEVPEGGVTALLGRNGVGDDDFAGDDGPRAAGRSGGCRRRGAVKLPTHAIVRRGIGYVPEDRDVFAGLTVDENLRLAERNGSPYTSSSTSSFPELRTAVAAGGNALGRPAADGRDRPRAPERQPDPARRRADEGLAPLLVTEVAAALERAAELATVLLVEQNLAAVARGEAGRRARRRPWCTPARPRRCSATGGVRLLGARGRALSWSFRGGEGREHFRAAHDHRARAGAMYFLIASGLSLIYGLMGVLNFAHGALLTVGAYDLVDVDPRGRRHGRSCSGRSSASRSERFSRR